ncbi:MAG TPA: tRNA uracil 4-sulfurtransferase ThiI [Candidatus Acidoferrales bacterium]|nr:tRNA uracil 4-sulfurtransferase ThiI [Candidatus Acidoferrales bacterium]
MSNPVIVVHYHELWLKGANRRFFLGKLFTGLRQSLEGIGVERIEQPGDRFLVRLREGASVSAAVERVRRVLGVANFAVAQPVERDLDAICGAAWNEVEPLTFATFAVRAKRSDKRFPHPVMQIEAAVGKYLLDRLRAQGRDVRVHLREPELTCRIEITPGPALVYAKKMEGAGGLPANTAGKITCLLSGGYDSVVAAYQMMKRGAHLSFVHFYGTGARPGESSLHVAAGLVRQLTNYQFNSKLYRVPFEAIQREIVRYAPEDFRVLLYRRMMLRIAQVLATREHALALVTGDSLGQVASQTLRNLVAVDAAAKMPIFRPLIGTDKIEILDTARKIGTYEISSEPFHDCCPVFLPKAPALFATPEQLDEAESRLDIAALVEQGVRGASLQKFTYASGDVGVTESQSRAAVARQH